MQEDAIKRAIDIAHRANGFAEKLHEEGFIRRGDIVRETRDRILSLETEHYEAFIITSILETAEVLKRMLDKAQFDSGERKYYPVKDTRKPQRPERGKHGQDSDSISVTIHIYIRRTCVGIVEYVYATLRAVLEAFDINDLAEIWEVLS